MRNQVRLRAIFKVGILNTLAYRADFILGVFSGISLVTIQFFIWNTVFINKNSIGSFSLEETVTYMAMVWVTYSMYNTQQVSRNIQDKMLSGAITYDFLFPINYQIFSTILTYSVNLMNLIITGSPIFIIALLFFNIKIPMFINLLYFIFSIHLSFLISFGISYIIGLMSVYFKNIEGIIQVEKFLRIILSGALLPLSFLPSFINIIADILPFKGMVSIPILIYLGKLSGKILIKSVLIQIFWVLVIFLIGHLLFNKAIKKLEVFGG